MARWMLLDLDGTLVDSVPDLAAALNRTLAAHALAPLGNDAVTGMVGDGASKLVERGFGARGVCADAAMQARFLADYTAHASDHSRTYPGVMEGLEQLRARGWTLAVCTNKPEAAARALLVALGLAPFFASVGGGDSFAVRKPDPGHLLATLSAAGGEVGRCVMVGDHHNDIIAATDAGVASVFVRWGYGVDVPGASAAISRFAELPDVAERLVAEH